MEYSVYDLVRILLKKWHIILVAACVVAGLSMITAQRSYEKAVKDYESLTSELIVTDVVTGSLSASYEYDYRVADFSPYLREAERKLDFWEEFQSTLFPKELAPIHFSDLVDDAYVALQTQATDLLTSSLVLQNTQSAMDRFSYLEPPKVEEDGTITLSKQPLDILNHLDVELIANSVVCIHITALEEKVARQLLEEYHLSLAEVAGSSYALEVSFTETACEFYPDPLQLTKEAQLAQIVMEKPSMAPIISRTVVTSGAFAAVIACFGILLCTFIKDSTAQQKKQAKGLSSQGADAP